MPDGLDSERPLLELELRIAALQATDDPAHADEVARLQDRLERQRQRTYAALTPWQRTQLARHPKRPHTRDWCKLLLDRKSTRLNSSHQIISYAVFCLKKKKQQV